MTTKTRCEAKNPVTCRYHGTRLEESQWLPDYATAHARLDNLNSRVMSTHGSRTVFNQLETERQQAILDVDASKEGLTRLGEQIDKARLLDTKPNFWAEEKLKAALAHRQHALAAAAIADFEGMQPEEYIPSTAERLFFGLTNVSVFEQDGMTVVASVDETTGHAIFDEYDLTNPTDRERLVTKRREFEASEAARVLYTAPNLRQDVLGHRGAKIDMAGNAAVLRQDGVAYARIEFNQDGSFNRAIAARDAEYSLFLESSTALRMFIHETLEGERALLPIPDYLAA